MLFIPANSLYYHHWQLSNHSCNYQHPSYCSLIGCHYTGPRLLHYIAKCFGSSAFTGTQMIQQPPRIPQQQPSNHITIMQTTLATFKYQPCTLLQLLQPPSVCHATTQIKLATTQQALRVTLQPPSNIQKILVTQQC